MPTPKKLNQLCITYRLWLSTNSLAATEKALYTEKSVDFEEILSQNHSLHYQLTKLHQTSLHSPSIPWSFWPLHMVIFIRFSLYLYLRNDLTFSNQFNIFSMKIMPLT